MNTDRVARRYAASSFPEIKGVRLSPPGAPATLINLSATGVLVECESRLLPGADQTVEFDGGFEPASIPGRVIRCEVIGIAASGSLRYRIGLAFNSRIALTNDAADAADARPPAPDAPSPVAVAKSPTPAPALRNRW